MALNATTTPLLPRTVLAATPQYGAANPAGDANSGDLGNLVQFMDLAEDAIQRASAAEKAAQASIAAAQAAERAAKKLDLTAHQAAFLHQLPVLSVTQSSAASKPGANTTTLPAHRLQSTMLRG